MKTRRASLWIVPALMVVVVAAGAGCATSGSSSAGYSAVSGFDDCANLYPPVTSGYPTTYYPSNDEDGPCSAYPRVEGYYPEYVQRPVREVTAAQARDHHGHLVSRGEPQGWSSRFGDGSSDASSSGSSGSSGSGGGMSVPRMEPIPVGSPSPSSSASPGPGTVTVSPREH